MTGSWKPVGTWHRIHGDSKSTTGGKWHMETMTTSQDPATYYKVRLIEDGNSVWTEEWKTKSEPSFESIVLSVQAARG